MFEGLYTQHLADELRNDLEAAKVERPQLFERSETRRPLRLHDLRSTFVTVSLANGKTETWVSGRTGHRSSAMLNRYRRAARTWSELGLGELTPLDVAIPDLAPSPPGKGQGSGHEPREATATGAGKSSGEKGIRTPGAIAGTPDFESGTFGHSDISPPRKFPDRALPVKRRGVLVEQAGAGRAYDLRGDADALRGRAGRGDAIPVQVG